MRCRARHTGRPPASVIPTVETLAPKRMAELHVPGVYGRDHTYPEERHFAYGPMDEPHDTQGLWPAAAQAAIDAIRSVDRQHTLVVCGDGWSGPHSWQRINRDLLLHDPAENLADEAHQHSDRDSSGTYKQSYDVWLSGKRPYVLCAGSA